ncbi:hypothetical protein SDRG_03831 [Saprolegnia diclina VS20]|uniref:rRNA biogenesis protein RRP36 n=1 Tax=Saprolegnia diclina (strain VS20) TaxID=1156394 RepID=T0S1H5_SAPDV|nr:hypothetical protein SDRG_03831 [Saprolegnia diclina VS20]EQC38873.1 hypothetical protein SDRG_03831 [Saprolegnia diclina VS20]|eukprot:XP_008607697.1 hypothetical protein SDRG_03831 [Saprolegnia diclina VS20]
MAKGNDADLTIEERLALKKSGFANAPKAASSDEGSGDDDDGPTTKRANKNCPREMTSKRPVARFREVLQIRKKASRDPRFDAASGKLNEDLFKKAYTFLEDYKDAELDEVKKQLKKAKSATRKAALKEELASRKQERAETHRADKIREATQKRKREEREAVANGKSAFYLKRKDKKQVELKAKYDELQESGRLSKFMAKRRKKNANKDHRWLPTQRKETA